MGVEMDRQVGGLSSALNSCFAAAGFNSPAMSLTAMICAPAFSSSAASAV
jgi:hypothetical protein